MYENEAVDENEAKNYAKENNAIFQKTSAKDSTGIDLLFIKLANKFLNHSADVDSIEQKDTSGTNENKNDNNSNIKLDEKAKDAKKKKKCC